MRKILILILLILIGNAQAYTGGYYGTIILDTATTTPNYQVKISDQTINIPALQWSIMNQKGNDTVFTSNDGLTTFPHWIEYIGNASNYSIYVNVTTNQTLFIRWYYGNGQASTSNGNTTFPVFGTWGFTETDPQNVISMYPTYARLSFINLDYANTVSHAYRLVPNMTSYIIEYEYIRPTFLNAQTFILSSQTNVSTVLSGYHNGAIDRRIVYNPQVNLIEEKGGIAPYNQVDTVGVLNAYTEIHNGTQIKGYLYSSSSRTNPYNISTLNILYPMQFDRVGLFVSLNDGYRIPKTMTIDVYNYRIRKYALTQSVPLSIDTSYINSSVYPHQIFKCQSAKIYANFSITDLDGVIMNLTQRYKSGTESVEMVDLGEGTWYYEYGNDNITTSGNKTITFRETKDDYYYLSGGSNFIFVYPDACTGTDLGSWRNISLGTGNYTSKLQTEGSILTWLMIPWLEYWGYIIYLIIIFLITGIIYMKNQSIAQPFLIGFISLALLASSTLIPSEWKNYIMLLMSVVMAALVWKVFKG